MTENIEKIIKEKGGRYLGKIYSIKRSRYLAEIICKNGHKWNTEPCNIISGQWCKECFKNNKEWNIQKIKEYSQKKSILCLSDTYNGYDSKLKWKCCECDHEWMTTFRTIKHSRCPICAKKFGDAKKRKLSENDMKMIVKSIVISHNGKLLSKSCSSTNQKLQFECEYGHKFERTFTSLRKHGYWCSYCKLQNSIGESITKCYFEYLFNSKFPKIRPSWLINEKGNAMELDGYNEELKLAFEYNGYQHYHIDAFHRTENDLQVQQYRDKIKQELCKKNGITLIIIPYTIALKKIQKYIAEKYEELTNKNISGIPYKDYLQFNVYSFTQISKLKEYAKSKGGDCLSTIYISVKEKVQWKCSEGHIWAAIPTSVIHMNHWCPICAKKRVIKNLKHQK